MIVNVRKSSNHGHLATSTIRNILVNQKLRNCVWDFEAYSTFRTLDHIRPLGTPTKKVQFFIATIKSTTL